MKPFVESLILIQFCLFFRMLYLSVKDQNLFSLRSLLAISCFLYISLPTAICLNSQVVVVNGITVKVFLEPLMHASLGGLLFLAATHFIPNKTWQSSREDTSWVLLLLCAISAIELYYLFQFMLRFSFSAAFAYINLGAAGAIRDLSFVTLSEIKPIFGYVLGAVQLACFGYLWIRNTYEKKWLLFLISPQIILSFLSLSRHSLASFLVVLFFCVDYKKTYKNLYIYASVVLFSLFFFRTGLFYLLQDDQYLANELQDLINPQTNGMEIIGEFFNTYSTSLMAYSLPEVKINFTHTIASVFAVIFIPPGLTSSFYKFLELDNPIFKIGDVIQNAFLRHPAHSSLVDIYSFGVVALLGVLCYFYFLLKSSKSGQINDLLYFYLLSVFYMPFRGSLLMGAIRLFWLYWGFLFARWFFNSLLNFIKQYGKD